MATFKLNKKIKSCLVSNGLIRELEDYIFNNLPKLLDFTKREIKENYSLSISDRIGEEELSSISDYRKSLFADTTKEIDIKLYIFSSPKELIIHIRFSKERTFADIDIKNSSDSPREAVIGIYESIKEIIESYKTSNSIYHFPSAVTWVMSVIAVLSFFFLIYIAENIRELTRTGITLARICSMLLLICILYMCTGYLFKPYISFESNRYKSIKKWSDWFFWGILTFIVFGTIFLFLRKKILGL